MLLQPVQGRLLVLGNDARTFRLTLRSSGPQIIRLDKEIRMRSIPSSQAALLLIMLAMVSASYAATPFDGKWKGQSNSKPSRCETIELTFAIANGEFIQFQLVTSNRTEDGAKGNVSEYGNATIHYSPISHLGSATEYHHQAAIVFKGDTFEGQFDTPCGFSEISGVRAR